MLLCIVMHCHVLLICSVIFTISRSVDYSRGTDMREGRREGIRGEGKENTGRKYARHMNIQKFLTMKPLTRNHSFVAQKCSKTHIQQSKNQQIFRGYYPRTPASWEGRGKRRMGEWMLHPSLRLWLWITVLMKTTEMNITIPTIIESLLLAGLFLQSRY